LRALNYIRLIFFKIEFLRKKSVKKKGKKWGYNLFLYIFLINFITNIF